MGNLSCYPNPFNSSTILEYSIPRSSAVKLSVYDLLGREIAVLFEGEQNAGEHTVVWNASAVPSGIYFYRIETPGFVDTRKMILIK